MELSVVIIIFLNSTFGDSFEWEEVEKGILVCPNEVFYQTKEIFTLDNEAPAAKNAKRCLSPGIELKV